MTLATQTLWQGSTLTLATYWGNLPDIVQKEPAVLAILAITPSGGTTISHKRLGIFQEVFIPQQKSG